ncbi:MAG: hypothetical protein NC131_20940 [Roseburia sp.]|nr:hypothetical protein [Roseburia sp.]
MVFFFAWVSLRTAFTKEAECGLSDYREYATEKATVDELLEQNSYFVNTLYGG